jgi:hypothetical protein
VALAIETELAQPQSHNLTDPLIYLLHCSEVELGNFELTKLSEIRNLQAHLRDVQESIFEIGNQVTLARLVRMRAVTTCEGFWRLVLPIQSPPQGLRFGGRALLGVKLANVPPYRPAKRIETRRRSTRPCTSKTDCVQSVPRL